MKTMGMGPNWKYKSRKSVSLKVCVTQCSYESPTSIIKVYNKNRLLCNYLETTWLNIVPGTRLQTSRVSETEARMLWTLQNIFFTPVKCYSIHKLASHGLTECGEARRTSDSFISFCIQVLPIIPWLPSPQSSSCPVRETEHPTSFVLFIVPLRSGSACCFNQRRLMHFCELDYD